MSALEIQPGAEVSIGVGPPEVQEVAPPEA